MGKQSNAQHFEASRQLVKIERAVYGNSANRAT